ADNDNAAVFLYQELPLGGAADATELRTPKLQFGARWDTWSVKSKANDPDRFGPARSRSFSNASGSLGLSVPFGGMWSLSGSVARAFRAPTVEELYANGEHKAVGTVDIGNANLRAETSTGGEAILRAQSGRSFLQLSAYATRIDDYILPIAVRDTTLVEDGEIEVKPLVNFIQRNATLRGIELSGETAVTPSLVLGVMSDVVRGTVSGGGNLPFITGRLQLGADVRHAFEQTRVSDANPTATRNASDIATGSYTLLNLHATWTVVGGASAQTITLRADNLLDEQFRDAASRVKSFTFNPGRNISVVYRIGF
ncbi:MAG: TonB-dependent receptor, partial [Gemmatimonadaceae bacterium]|nr:TonB-dependent receptor [Gemmatimonadaceae bacterium]